MEKFIMLMWLCSTVNTPPCFEIKIPKKVFDDHYSCVSFGYSHSMEVITKLKIEDVNRMGLYTRFACIKETISKKETNA